MPRIYIDRSRILEREKCPRKRWLTYHESGTGIVPAKTPLPLAVGGAVHAGLAVLLGEGSVLYSDSYQGDSISQKFNWEIVERKAVQAALEEFSTHRQGIALDAGEVAAMQPTEAAKTFQSQVIAQAAELGMDPAQFGTVTMDSSMAQSEFDRYLWSEQSALVEGLVRAYARRRLRPLLEQFEVLEVEREGEWKLSEWEGDFEPTGETHESSLLDPKTLQPWTIHEHEQQKIELWFMSRPDALLRERQTNELYLLSYKTTAQ